MLSSPTQRSYVLLGAALALPIVVLVILQLMFALDGERRAIEQRTLSQATQIATLSDSQLRSDLAVMRILATAESMDRRDWPAAYVRAREVTDFRQRRTREQTATARARGTLEQMFNKIREGEAKELAVVVKTDVQGSLEAIAGSLAKLRTDEVAVRLLHGAVGGITEGDIALAKASTGVIVGFNVRANPQAREMAKRDGIEIRYYSIIYDLIDDIKGVLSGMLSPIQRETFLGNAEVLQAFDITKVGRVAGCRVTEGVVRKGARVRIIRQDVVVLELGVLQTLKRFKDEVNEVPNGQECGMAFQGFQDIKVGDTIECFNLEEVKRYL